LTFYHYIHGTLNAKTTSPIMLDLSFFLGPLLESTSGHWLGGQEARKNFENDVQLFLEKQKRDTSLDVFFFANRPDIRTA
jgi:hypothetical protein